MCVAYAGGREHGKVVNRTGAVIMNEDDKLEYTHGQVELAPHEDAVRRARSQTAAPVLEHSADLDME